MTRMRANAKVVFIVPQEQPVTEVHVEMTECQIKSVKLVKLKLKRALLSFQ